MTLHFTPEQIAAIKSAKMPAPGTRGAVIGDLAKRFRCSGATISYVRNGKWEADAEKRRTIRFVLRRGYMDGIPVTKESED